METIKIIFSFVAIILVSEFLFGEEVFKYDAKAKRDPFVPLVSEDGIYASDVYGITSIKDIRLEGIVWDEAKGSIAIINGEIVREDQEIGIVKVLKIEKDAVVFDLGGQEVRVELTTD